MGARVLHADIALLVLFGISWVLSIYLRFQISAQPNNSVNTGMAAGQR
jgi:hypothetical protein